MAEVIGISYTGAAQFIADLALQEGIKTARARIGRGTWSGFDGRRRLRYGVGQGRPLDVRRVADLANAPLQISTTLTMPPMWARDP